MLDEFGPEALKPMHHIVAMRVERRRRDGGGRAGQSDALGGSGASTGDRAGAQPRNNRSSDDLSSEPAGVRRHCVFGGDCVRDGYPRGGGGSVPWVARPGLAAAGAFLAVFGCRLAWLKVYSRPMPYWDEWEMSGLNLLMPLRGHFLDWQALFMPHSEHRTLVSRLIVLRRGAPQWRVGSPHRNGCGRRHAGGKCRHRLRNDRGDGETIRLARRSGRGHGRLLSFRRP